MQKIRGIYLLYSQIQTKLPSYDKLLCYILYLHKVLFLYYTVYINKS